MGQSVSSNGMVKRLTNSNQQPNIAIAAKKIEKLQRLRQNSESTDVTLVCGNKEYIAHKLILSASSPLFRSCFSSSTVDTGRVCVSLEIENGVMEKVIDYIYRQKKSVTGIKDVKELMKILQVAHELQFQELFDTCCLMIADVATAQDFPTVTSLDKYERETASSAFHKFFSTHNSAIFRYKLYQHYTYQHFEIFLNMTCAENLLSSEDLVKNIIFWAMSKSFTRSEFVGLVSISYKYGFHKTFLESPTVSSILNRNPSWVMETLKELPDPYVKRISTNVKSTFTPKTNANCSLTADEVKILKYARIVQFQRTGDKNVCVQQSFLKSDQVVPEVFKTNTVAFEFSDDMKFAANKEKVYIVSKCQSDATNGKTKYQCEKYRLHNNTREIIQKFRTYKDIEDVVVFNDKLLFIEKTDEQKRKWFHFTTGTKYTGKRAMKSRIDGINTALVGPTKLFTINGDIAIIVADDSNSGENDTQINLLTNLLIRLHEGFEFNTNSFRPEMDEAEGWISVYVHAPYVSYCALNYVITTQNTVHFGNYLFTFCEQMLHVLDPYTNMVQTCKSGILVKEGDVIYKIPGQYQHLLIVHRQNKSDEQYSYKMWNICQKKCVAELAMAKGSFWETVTLVKSH